MNAGQHRVYTSSKLIVDKDVSKAHRNTIRARVHVTSRGAFQMKHWIMASRLRTLPAAIAPVLLGWSICENKHTLAALLLCWVPS